MENSESLEPVSVDDAEVAGDELDKSELSDDDSIELDIRESIEELKKAQPLENGDKPIIKAEGEGEKSQGEPKRPVNDEKAVKEVASATKEPAKEAEKAQAVAAPATWTVEGKQWFNAQPLEVKKEIAKRTTDMERQFHKVTTEAATIKREYADIDDAIRPFEKEWATRGVSRSQAIRNLVAANAYIEQDLKGGLEMIARSYGTTLAKLASEDGQDGGSQAVLNTHLQPLMARIQSLESELQTAKQEKEGQSRQSVLSELYSVRDETDGNGRYLRPELHDENFVAQMGPVYKGLQQSFPSATPREILLKAYVALTGKAIEPQRVQAQAQEHKEKARQATSSVRGVPAAKRPQEVRKGPEDPEDTIRQVIRELRGDA